METPNDLHAVYGIKYLHNKLLNIKSYAHRLLKYITLRDENTCRVCEKTLPIEHLTIHVINEDEPCLENSITVCKTCKARMLQPNSNNAKRFNLMFYPYLRRKTINLFNDEHKEHVGVI